MSFTDFITDHGRRIRKEHFIHLVQVARLDDKIQPSELELLHKEGKKFGLTDPEIDEIIKSEKTHYYDPPYSLSDKFDQLYNISNMILADDIVTEAEKKMVKIYAIAAGFKDENVEKLLDFFIDEIKKGTDEETLFTKLQNLVSFK
jgi:hypothetical protein